MLAEPKVPAGHSVQVAVVDVTPSDVEYDPIGQTPPPVAAVAPNRQ